MGVWRGTASRVAFVYRSAQDLNVWSVVQVEVSDASSEDAFKVDMCK